VQVDKGARECCDRRMFRRWFLGLLLTIGLTGCPRGPTFVSQQYAGAKRDAETIAILRVNGNERVRLLKLDEEGDLVMPLAEDSRIHFELLPGRHSVVAAEVNPTPNGPQLRGAERIELVALAGKVYRVVFANQEPRIHEVDRDSDALGADVTLPPPRPPETTARPPASNAPSQAVDLLEKPAPSISTPRIDEPGTITVPNGQ
jgi:hypothetical protein